MLQMSRPFQINQDTGVELEEIASSFFFTLHVLYGRFVGDRLLQFFSNFQGLCVVIWSLYYRFSFMIFNSGRKLSSLNYLKKSILSGMILKIISIDRGLKFLVMIDVALSGAPWSRELLPLLPVVTGRIQIKLTLYLSCFLIFFCNIFRVDSYLSTNAEYVICIKPIISFLRF